MPNILVVNADDFGLTEGHNHAIVDAHTNGIVTSTSLLANGLAFDQAVQLALQTSALGIGVHLTLTEGNPVAGPQPELLTSQGQLPLSNQFFVKKLLTGQLPTEAITREFRAQIQRVLAAGIQPTHLDGHKYIHLLPGIAGIVARLADEFGIRVIRRPAGIRGNQRIPGKLILTGLSQLAARRFHHLHGDHFVGFGDTGRLTITVLERDLLPPYPGITDVVCHPAYHTPLMDSLAASGYTWINTYDFAHETAAVSDSSLRQRLESAGWQFTHWGNVQNRR